jgi:hypothetical protein
MLIYATEQNCSNGAVGEEQLQLLLSLCKL